MSPCGMLQDVSLSFINSPMETECPQVPGTALALGTEQQRRKQSPCPQQLTGQWERPMNTHKIQASQMGIVRRGMWSHVVTRR